MPKSEREEALSALSHHEVARSKVTCPQCNTHCGSVHVPGSAGTTDIGQAPTSTNNANALSRPATPSSAASNELSAKLGAAGTNTPTGKDGNLYLVCVVCSRQIASNRYAPHLASCMGLNSTRRGATRGTVKSKLSSEAGRSASPISETESNSGERVNNKAKAKGDEGEFALNGNGKRKRLSSPQLSPNKKSKKGKMGGSPVSRIKADIAGLPTSQSHYSTNSQSKIPSKLRDSSIASFHDHSSTSSRDSSLEAVPTPASSTISSQSPIRPPPAAMNLKPAPRSRPTATGTGPPPKRPSPPKPQPIHVPHYEIDHANETGSSTDTDGDS